MNYKISITFILIIALCSCAIIKNKIYGIYKTEKRNVRQMTLQLKLNNSFSLTLQASMLYDSIYGKYLIKKDEIILLSELREDISHKVFSDSVKVNLLNQRKVQILNQTLKKSN